MNRRHFSQQISLALGATMLPMSFAFSSPNRRIIKPPRLKPGDTIGIITPGSYISDEKLEKAVQNIQSLGLKTRLSKHIRAKRGYNAGTDQQRLEDIHAMFADPEIKGIWCARGGYGCSRLLPLIDYKLIRRNPKVLIGYSDVTALLNAIYLKTGLIGIHGPVGSSDFTDYTLTHLSAVLLEQKSSHEIPIFQDEDRTKSEYLLKVMHSGQATGQLVGGNLSLIAAMVGSGYLPDFKDKIVFLEDIEEGPYRVDRMLTQVLQGTRIDQAAGLALGIFDGCDSSDEDSLGLIETIEDRLGGLGIPLIYGLSFGHISNQCTLPVGIEATLHTEKATLTLLENSLS